MKTKVANRGGKIDGLLMPLGGLAVRPGSRDDVWGVHTRQGTEGVPRPEALPG